MKTIMMMVFACAMTGCMAQELTPADDPAPATSGPATSDPVTSDPATSEASDQLATPAGAIDAAAANCVSIQWCDQPNSTNGTVCVVRNTAACQAHCIDSTIINECNADAAAVCGGTVANRRIFGC
jgi:hypothetical protein